MSNQIVRVFLETDMRNQHDGLIYRIIPSYSTSIEAAWEVVEKLNEDNFSLQTNGSGWKARFDVYGSAQETVPHVICIAALKFINQQT